jgi:hypothetical protein
MKLLRMAVALWIKKPGLSDNKTASSNARKWLAAVDYLGDKWILSRRVERKEHPSIPVLNSVKE